MQMLADDATGYQFLMIEQKHKQLILLDFDHTLFNTTQFVNRLQEVFHSLGVDHEDFHQHRHTLNDLYTIDDISHFIDRLTYANKKALHEIMFATIESEAQHFVFDDVNDFLLRHQDTFDLVILTQGDQQLQSEKILHSNFSITIPSIIVPKDKYLAISDFAERYEKIFFVDDMTANIDSAKRAYPQVTTYFMQREADKPYASVVSTCDCADFVITNLQIDFSKDEK